MHLRLLRCVLEHLIEVSKYGHPISPGMLEVHCCLATFRHDHTEGFVKPPGKKNNTIFSLQMYFRICVSLQCNTVNLQTFYLYFWFKYDSGQKYLGQKYYAPQVRPDWGSNLWPPDHDSIFHVSEMPALTTWPTVTYNAFYDCCSKDFTIIAPSDLFGLILMWRMEYKKK